MPRSTDIATPTGRLMDWYDAHARDLPWRVPPHEIARGIKPDPYRVWLSEVMLQQTTVAAVKDYFTAFTARWPDVQALAAASEDDVMKAWAGLGYYSRARNLKACADRVAKDLGGQFPQSAEGLRVLPGIGDYTSAAIASIAFNEPVAVMDGNVERVFSRFHAIATPLPAAKTEIKPLVAAMMDEARPGDFAQACMDLGATICTPRRPSCLVCPLRHDCAVLTLGLDAETFPVKSPKKEKPVRVGAAFVIEREDGAILLEKRGPKGLLANMAQVPTTGWTARLDGTTDTSDAPFALAWRKAGTISHVFTHFELRLHVWHGRTDTEALDGQWWSPRTQVDGEALPTVMKKAIACAIDSFERNTP